MSTLTATDIAHLTWEKIIKPMYRDAVPEPELRLDAQTYVILTALLDHDYETAWCLQVRTSGEDGESCDALAVYQRGDRFDCEWFNQAAETFAWYRAGNYDESLVWFVGWDIAMRELLHPVSRADSLEGL